eukprot:CAMPEP_0204273426 /NCGR_PEP_ID=MMETSP0468-20130131/23311_1 /ASSEMBLY_ACC=CAM_ASM_000383 /TAXON_ID=2969 /ORGANISM="Oxyrrhis marina" /LENGTH=117 /DNA_ID=CAMNT_0051249439 /DNA_START=391 /DNA_END=744 /DNA_ORIENTATION=-
MPVYPRVPKTARKMRKKDSTRLFFGVHCRTLVTCKDTAISPSTTGVHNAMKKSGTNVNTLRHPTLQSDSRNSQSQCKVASVRVSNTKMHPTARAITATTKLNQPTMYDGELTMAAKW